MAEQISTFEKRINELEPRAADFFGAWADNHASTMYRIGRLDFDPLRYPFQGLREYKTLSLANRGEIDDAEAAAGAIHFVITDSFKKDPEKGERFMKAFREPYPYNGGDGRTYLEVLVEDYLARGKSVAAILSHADEGLSDLPRFAGALASTLGQNHGVDYMGRIGLVASKTIAYETYDGTPIPEVVSYTDLIWTVPQTDNKEVYRRTAGLTQPELEEIYELVNAGGIRAVHSSLRPNDKGLGYILAVNPTGTRAKAMHNSHGDLVSLTLGSISKGSGRLVTSADGLWPVAVVNGEMKLGPILSIEDTPKGLSKEGRVKLATQRAEDAMDLAVDGLNDILGGGRPAKFPRQTKRGEIYRKYGQGDTSRSIGATAQSLARSK